MAERRLFDGLQEVHRAFCEEREAQRSDVLKLRAAHERLSAEVAALCRCLRKRGGLGEEQLQAELHRTRFEEAKRRSHWAPNGDALWTVLEVVGASRTAALAGGEASCALRAASEALRDSLDALREQRLYVAGGATQGWPTEAEVLKSCESFGPPCEEWEPLELKMPWTRYAHCAAALGGSLYVCGGQPPIAHTVVRFSRKDRKWKYERGMLSPRAHSAAAAVGRRLFVCGGTDGTQVWRSVECFTPGGGESGTGAWEHLPVDMSEQRRNLAAVSLRGQLLLCGGSSAFPGPADAGTFSDTAQAFSPMAAEWRALPPMTTCRLDHAAAALQGCAYVCGGLSKDGLLASVERFDPVAGAWLLVPPMREPRFNHAVAALAGRLYVCGGHGEPQPHSDVRFPARSSVERFGAATGSWEVAEPMGQARCLFSAVVVSGGLPVAGGGVGHAEAA
mmetsp:Transcript_66315/g.209629  ORF Transcript_66315/g.209629 Transcript_66315/m.209629 type:complete len:449 (+) Transcript_66315:49-1395(+)